MGIPPGIGVIDTMIGFPDPPGEHRIMTTLRPLLRDEGSQGMRFPAEYMFKEVPDGDGGDAVAVTLREMDRFGIERGLVGVSDADADAQRALRDHPDRFFACANVNPHRGMDAVRDLRRMVDTFGVKAANGMASALVPPEPVSGKHWYPVYAACVDLGIPMIHCVGVPGPRLPMAAQHPEHLDEVCYDFPELKLVMRHGAEPWTALAVKLLLKWPNLYYSTSAFAPKYYPTDIIEFANTRGADKVLYAGYFPFGLSLERIFKELPDVALDDEVWPKFLRENAMKVFEL
jgi:predicted TIM-barrel fold metal-dependent hydrolase